MTAVIGPDHKLTVQLPSDFPTGEHRIVMTIEEKPLNKGRRSPLQFSSYPVGLVSDAFTFRREDLYGDDGR